MHPATVPPATVLVLYMLVLPGMFAKAHAKNDACIEEEWKEREGRLLKRRKVEEERSRSRTATSPAFQRKILAKQRHACVHGVTGSPLDFNKKGQLYQAGDGRGRRKIFGKMCCAMQMYTTVFVSLGFVLKGDNFGMDKLHVESGKSDTRHRADERQKAIQASFDGVVFSGIIVAFKAMQEEGADKGPALYKAQYSDGDVESLELHEVHELIEFRASYCSGAGGSAAF